MPTDLSLSREITREQLDRYRHPGMHFSDKGGLEVTVARGMFEHLLRVAEAHLAEPARIAAARQEGYREGVADAKQAAGFAAWRHEGDDAHSRGMDAGARHQVAECVKAIVALSPLPAEPSAPVAEGEGANIASLRAEVEEQARAYGSDAYFPTSTGAMLAVFARIATLEAENAALREGLDSILSRYVGTLDAGAGNYDGKAYAESLPEVQRARALLQGGPDAG